MDNKRLSSNPLVYLFQMSWRFSAGNRKNIVLYWLLFTVANSTRLLLKPLLWAMVLNIITAEGVHDTTIRRLLILLVLIGVLDLVFWCLHGPARVLERNNAFKARASYRKYILQGVMNLPMEWHVSRHSGDTIDKIEKGSSALYAFSEGIFKIIGVIVYFVGSLVVFIYFSPVLALIVIAALCVSIWITTRFDRILLGQYSQLNRAENAVSESVFDAISNISTVIILRVERLIFSAIVHKIDSPYSLANRNNWFCECKWFLTSMCCAVMVAMVMGIYFWQNYGAGPGILVGSTYLLLNYLTKISEIFFDFTGMYGEVLQRKAKVDNAQLLTEEFAQDRLVNHVLPQGWQQLQIQNLTFAYNDGGDTDNSEPQLNNVSLCINSGERILLVGETGCGKTTLLKLIRGLHKPQELALYVDGIPLPDGFMAIDQAISLIPQEPEIFATTVENNITLGAEYERSLIERYVAAACFADVIDSLPNGLDTSMKERGVNLSGGQKQRLALVRGLLASHSKDIVLLDEATSSLDPHTALCIYQNIFREFEGKTIISTVHQLHLAPLFDRIIVFDQGRIVGTGTIAELLTTCPQFQVMWNHSMAETVS